MEGLFPPQRADPNGPLLLRLREDQNVMSHVAFPYEGRISPRVSRRFLEVLREASNESA